MSDKRVFTNCIHMPFCIQDIGGEVMNLGESACIFENLETFHIHPLKVCSGNKIERDTGPTLSFFEASAEFKLQQIFSIVLLPFISVDFGARSVLCFIRAWFSGGRAQDFISGCCGFESFWEWGLLAILTFFYAERILVRNQGSIHRARSM